MPIARILYQQQQQYQGRKGCWVVEFGSQELDQLVRKTILCGGYPTPSRPTSGHPARFTLDGRVPSSRSCCRFVIMKDNNTKATTLTAACHAFGLVPAELASLDRPSDLAHRLAWHHPAPLPKLGGNGGGCLDHIHSSSISSDTAIRCLQ
jgi:hypothetical protein